MSLRSRVSMFACGLAAAMFVSVLSSPACAGTYTWDPASNGSLTGGAGAWNTGSVWYYSGSDVLWGDGNDAVFQGTGGSVTVSGTVTPTNIYFNGPGYSISGGTVNFTYAGATINTSAASATINSAVTASNLYTAGTGALTITGGLTATLLNQNSNSGQLTVIQPAGFSGTIGTVSATTSGTTVVLEGDPTSTTNITNVLNTAGQTVTFNGGNWNLIAGGAYGSTLIVNSGLVTRPLAAPTGGDFFDLQSVTVNGGTLNLANLYGMRMGNQGGAGFNYPCRIS